MKNNLKLTSSENIKTYTYTNQSKKYPLIINFKCVNRPKKFFIDFGIKLNDEVFSSFIGYGSYSDNHLRLKYNPILNEDTVDGCVNYSSPKEHRAYQKRATKLIKKSIKLLAC